MLWELPGPRRFLSEILESLENGRHVLVYLPDSIERSNLQSEIGRGLHGRSLGDLTAIRLEDADEDPLDVVLSRLGSKAACIEELLSDGDLPTRFLLVDTLESKGGEVWRSLLSRAASHGQIQGGSALQLIVFFAAGDSLVAEDLFLSSHPWWGRFSGLDIDWVTQQKLLELPAESPAERHWLRALCRGLAPCDPLLAEQLVRSRPQDLPGILGILSPQPEAQRFSEVAEAREAAAKLRPGVPPSNGTALRLWRQGDLDWHEEQGGILLSRYVAALGDHDEISRRLWLGQLEVLMPAVERARLDACAFLVQMNGDGWPEVLCERAGIPISDAIDAEIGMLSQLAGALRGRGFSLPRRLSDVIFSWRDIRNELAHRRPVTLAACERAFAASQRLFG